MTAHDSGKLSLPLSTLIVQLFVLLDLGSTVDFIASVSLVSLPVPSYAALCSEAVLLADADGRHSGVFQH